MSFSDDLASLLDGSDDIDATFSYKTDPQSLDLPKITFFIPESKRLYSNDGDVGLKQPFVQIDILAASMTEARTLADAVTASFAALPITIGTTTIRCAILENEKEDAEPVEAGRQKPFQKIIQAWRFTIDGVLNPGGPEH